MKLGKKVFDVLLIFLIIQLIGTIVINNKVYASFFDDVFSRGKEFSSMASNNTISVNNITDATNDIYIGIRAIGIGIFLVNIVAIFITLSVKDTGKDIAGAKLTITFTMILALMFIFADKIRDFFMSIFSELENID